MKKLIIAGAFVCAIAFANAGCYTWGLTSGEDLTHNGGESYLADVPFTVMLFTGAIGQKANGDGTYALDFSSATYVTQTSDFAPGNYKIGGLAFDKTRTSDAVTGMAGQTYSMLVLDTGAGITDYAKYEGTYAIVSGSGVLNTDPEEGVSYAVFTTGTAITGDDYHIAAVGGEPVPEPTSGLLLILGVAGMALRRRRA